MKNYNKLSKKFFSKVLKVTKGQAELHEPIFVGNEWKYLKKCLDSTYVSTVGKFVKIFERKICNYTKSKYAIAANNGTAALHVAMELVGVKKNHEVLVPALNYISSSNTIIYCGADPHFIDVNENTLGIDSKKLSDYLKKNTINKSKKCINKKTKKIIKAIIIMHTYGHPVEIRKVIKIAKKYNLKVIEDAAECIGSFYFKKHLGTFGDVGIISFNGNKTITTGAGGIILTNDRKLAIQAKHVTHNSKLISNYQILHDKLGYNYRMSNLNAAIGCAQLEKIGKILNAKRKLFKKYKKEFFIFKELKLFEEPKNSHSNYWLNTVLVSKNHKNAKAQIIHYCNKRGIKVRPVWKLMHKIKYLSKYQRMDLSNSEDLEKRIINLPSGPNLIINK